jgi:hypothetical protein
MKTKISLSAFLFCAAMLSHGQWTFTNLSAPKNYTGATVLGSKAYFAGGSNDSGLFSTVEIYDAQTGEWNTSFNLSDARELPFAVTCGSKVIFAGGVDFYISGGVFSTVDIYDTIDQSWTVEQLSVPRLQAAVVSHGSKVLFAGGANLQQGEVYDVVDIYDVETGVWTTASLSEPRVVWWAKVGDLAIFAGGYYLLNSSKRVDIYNFTTGTWSIDSLSVPRAFVGMTTIGNKVLIAGGMTMGNVASNIVDIYDASTGNWSTANLSQARAFCDNQNAVTVSGKAYFVGGGKIHLNGAYWTTAYNVIDIYDEADNSWSVDYMPLTPRIHHAVVATDNKIIIAGGYIMTPPFGCDSTVAIYTCPSSSCLPEGITFTTQEQIDNFQANYPGCTEVEGDVIISGSNITNLNGLNVLTSIQGNLNLEGNSILVNLIGLDNLSAVGGSLSIYNNPLLSEISSLGSLTSIGDGLILGIQTWLSHYWGNPSLINLTGLEGITSLTNLTIIGNHSLTDLTGLNNLHSISGQFLIAGNDSLSSLTGLEELAYIGGNLQFGSGAQLGWIGNPALTTLTGLDGLTEIRGDLVFAGTTLVNLEGLNNLAIIGNDLILYDNSFITMTGLDNLDSIYGNFRVGPYPGTGGGDWSPGGNSIPDFTGIENLTSIGGDLVICWNDSLSNLAGLENLTSIGGDLIFYVNGNLTSLVGLDNLTSIEGGLNLYSNHALISLSGLENLTVLGGNLSIGHNDGYYGGNSSLINLDGLNNISKGSINNLVIADNQSLFNCAAQSICDYLASPNGTIEIHDNAPGCNSTKEVEAACAKHCLPEGITFLTQAQVDSFQINYPGCIEIEGDVTIGASITNLNGLSVLTSIRGFLDIENNPFLTSLDGLDNLTYVDSCIWIGDNDALASLAGLESLSSVGYFLSIFGNASLSSISALKNLTHIEDGLFISDNDSLASLTGLEGLSSVGDHLMITLSPALTNLAGLDNISSIGGGLLIGNNKAIVNFAGLEGLTSIGAGSIQIYENPALVSLTGLENINAGTLNYLHLGNNISLSTCDVKSICDYLAAPGGIVEILNNASGCNSPDEVKAACTFSVELVGLDNEISIFPNPADKTLTIAAKNGVVLKEAVIYNQTGQKVLQCKPLNSTLDISKLRPGMYIVELLTGKGQVREKLMVE